MTPPLTVIVGALCIGVAIPLLIWGFTIDRQPDDPVRRNLRGDRPVPDGRRKALEQSAVDRALRPAIRWLGRRARKLTPAGWLEALDRRLRLAGSPARWTIERVLVAKVVLGALGLLSAVALLAGGIDVTSVALALTATFGAYFGPDAILWSRAEARQEAIALALPDVLDQMTISVEAGLGLDAALQRVVSNISGPLAEELARLLNDLKIGVVRRQALQNLLGRTTVPELRHFVLAIRQAEEFGLPVAGVLRIQAAELRVKRRQRAEERALKMSVKIVFPLTVCIFPCLFIVVLGPAIIRIGQVL